MDYCKISFLNGVGGNRNGIGDYFKRLDAAGRPAISASYDDFGVVLELMNLRRKSGVPHIGVFRPKQQGRLENPRYDQNPVQAAREYFRLWYSVLPPEFLRDEWLKQHVWLIGLGNEGRREHEWGSWWGFAACEFAKLALEHGLRTLQFGWSAGTPDIGHNDTGNVWGTDGMLAYLKMCHNHPNELGICVHEGANPNLNNLSPGDVRLVNSIGFITGRYMHIFDACKTAGLRNPRIFISECAWKYNGAADVATGMALDIPPLAEYYAQHPEVLGVSLWSLGSISAEYGEVYNQVQPYIVPITHYALSSAFEGQPTWADKTPHYQVQPPVVEPPIEEPVMNIREVAIIVADSHPSKVGVIEQSALPALEKSIRDSGEIAASSEIDFKVGRDSYKVKIGRKAGAVTDDEDTYHVVKVPNWSSVQRLKKA